MLFISQQIKGKGRGKGMGVPTINLIIPKDFQLQEGVFAVTVKIDNQSFIAAMHYGPIPVFGEAQKSLEVFLLDVSDENVPETEHKDIEVDVKKYLREIRNFPNTNELMKQIEKDVADVKNTLQ